MLAVLRQPEGSTTVMDVCHLGSASRRSMCRTGNMRQGIRCWKGSRGKHERPRRDCGLIRSRCRRGSGGRGAARTSGKSLCYTTILRPLTFSWSLLQKHQTHPFQNPLLECQVGLVDFSRNLTYLEPVQKQMVLSSVRRRCLIQALVPSPLVYG